MRWGDPLKRAICAVITVASAGAGHCVRACCVSANRAGDIGICGFLGRMGHSSESALDGRGEEPKRGSKLEPKRAAMWHTVCRVM